MTKNILHLIHKNIICIRSHKVIVPSISHQAPITIIILQEVVLRIISLMVAAVFAAAVVALTAAAVATATATTSDDFYHFYSMNSVKVF